MRSLKQIFITLCAGALFAHMAISFMALEKCEKNEDYYEHKGHECNYAYWLFNPEILS